MSNFDAAFRVLMHHEGTQYTNDPLDAGGPTKYGITLATYSSYHKRAATSDDIELLTEMEAAEIYQALFWNHLELDRIAFLPLAVVIFDQSVLNGSVGIIKRLQALLGIHEDGLMGGATFAAIEHEDAEKLTFKLLRSIMHNYTEIVKNRPTNVKFFPGWADRIFGLMDFMFFADLT